MARFVRGGIISFMYTITAKSPVTNAIETFVRESQYELGRCVRWMAMNNYSAIRITEKATKKEGVAS